MNQENILDLEEYNQGSDGFGINMMDALKSAGFKGSEEQFFSNILGVITDYIEENVKNVDENGIIKINTPLALKGVSIYAVVRCQIKPDGELNSLVNIFECSVDVDDENFSIADSLEDFYVRNWIDHPESRRFSSETETSMLEIAKRLKNRK